MHKNANCPTKKWEMQSPNLNSWMEIKRGEEASDIEGKGWFLAGPKVLILQLVHIFCWL
jgi:hypothetical protein